MIAHLGTGLMGAGFVRAALRRGETVHIWNRTHDKAHALEADGAKAFHTAAAAVRGAERVHITLSDDGAVDEVLASIESALGAGTVVLDHTTTAPTPTGERYNRASTKNYFFAHVPMFMGPKNALDCTGFMLASGPADRIARVRSIVAPMTGKLIELGEGDTRAAAFKLFGNMMLVFIVSGLADVYKFARSLGITPSDAQSLFNDFKPTGAIDVRGKNMAEGNFAAAWEMTMARKDVRLMLEEGALHGVQYDVLPAIAALFDKGIAAGRGSEDVGAVAAV